MDASATPSLTDAERRRGLVAAIASIAVFGAAIGHSQPFFAVRLEGYGASNSLIGLNAATTAVASLIVSPFLPELMTRFGIRKVMAGAFAVIFLGYACAFFAGPNYTMWFAARAFLGFGGAALFIASEVWINMAAPPDRRGSVIGVYATALAAGFAAGPLALEVTGYDGFAPFVAGFCFLIAAAPPILFAAAPPFESNAGGRSLAGIAALAPAVFVAVLIFAAAEAVMMGLAPVYGIRLGFGEETAGRIVIAYALGPVLFQILIGRAIDRFSPIAIFLVCAVIGFAGALAMPFAANNVLNLYALLIIWGGAIVGLNTCSLTFIGARFTGRELAAANAGLALFYNIGALIGPAATGPAMDIFGPDALAWTLAAFFAVLLALIWVRRRAQTP